MIRDVIVVGGGAAGLMAAIQSAKAGASTMVLEHMEKPGKKLYATGNGKCNFTNRRQGPGEYRSQNPELAWRAVQAFGCQDTLEFFASLGILPWERDGYCYPASEQASSVAEALCQEANRLGVTIKNNEKARRVMSTAPGFFVETGTYCYECRKVILACGGKAGKAFGSDGSGFTVARDLGHRIVSLAPALTGLKVKKPAAKLAGIRRKSGVVLRIGEQCYTAKGEVQFTAAGLSGIPIFELSRFAAEVIHNSGGDSITVDLDLLPFLEIQELNGFLQEQQRKNGYKTVAAALSGLLDARLTAAAFAASFGDKHSWKGMEKRRLEACAKEELWQICICLKHYRMEIIGTHSFEQAQGTAGGVDLSQVMIQTMESRLKPGIYFAGEILDVDGNCGGYNLQWAWTSGWLAGQAAGAAAVRERDKPEKGQSL